MHKAWIMLGSLGIGAGLTYLADPERGRRRRALVRDKATRMRRVSRDGLEVARRDLGNRTAGWVAVTAQRLRGETVDDAILVERVRAKLGRHCARPQAIAVTAEGGRVTLRGRIGAAEAGGLLDAIRRVAGVLAIEDQLERQEGGLIESPEARQRREAYWSPAYRLVTGIGGMGLLVTGIVRGGVLGTGLGLTGLGLLGRALYNQPLRGLLGLSPASSGFTVQKTLTVNAPIDEVFAFWSKPENFPRFMRHIREVRNLGGGRSHWVVSGPAGVPVEWDAVATRTIKNELISWRSVPGSTVGHTGTLHLQENPDGSTRLHIQMCYHPPAGVMGHALATLFGADPKHEMDEDLARMKLLIQREARLQPGASGSERSEGVTARRSEEASGPLGS